MKYLSVLLLVVSVAIIDFTGCRNKDDNPVGPIDSTMTGTSTLSGRVILPPYMFNYADTGDFSGVKIEVLNTQYHTKSDKNGRWQIQKLDSGIYSIQFTKQGYDTVLIRNMKLKNTDSIFVGKTGISGEPWGDVVLNELITGTIPSSTAQIVATVVKEYKDPKDSTKVVYREMSYDFSAIIGIGLHGLQVKTWDQLIFRNTVFYNIWYCLTNTPTIDVSTIPIMARGSALEVALDTTRRWKFVYDNTKPERFSKTGVYTIPFFNDENISTIADRYKYDLSNKEQLYLHIIPTWRQMGREDYNISNYEYWKRGDVVSIPIQWK
ncbi:MAG: carboxypeptidase-like regulatory domain-containing protein [Candidatus Kapaibacterium sp.]